MKLTIYILALSILAILGECSSNDDLEGNDKSERLDEAFELPMNQCASIDTFSICLKGVLNDSRCPTDVVCVWEGDASVQLSLGQDGSIFELHTNPGSQFTNDTIIGDYEIELLELTPYPVSDQTIEQADYSVSIIVTKLD